MQKKSFAYTLGCAGSENSNYVFYGPPWFSFITYQLIKGSMRIDDYENFRSVMLRLARVLHAIAVHKNDDLRAGRTVLRGGGS